MNRFFIFIILFLLYPRDGIRGQEYRIDDFADFEKQVNELEKQQQYDEAKRLTYLVQDQFPEREFDILKELIYLNEKTEKFENNLQIWAMGHEQGYFFLLSKRMKRYNPYLKFHQFGDLVKQDDALRIASFDQSRTIWEVTLPENYTSDRRYPLLIILHGGGSNLEKAKRRWRVIHELKTGYIVIFIQSYRHLDSNTFGWTSNDKRAHHDMKSCYRDIISTYSVDTTGIIMCGISAGGTMSFDVCFNRILPLSGIIAFCPGIPWKTKVESVRNLNTKVFMIGGERDYYLPKQKELVGLFKQSGVIFEHKIIPGMGHEFPEKYEQYMREGLKFVNSN